MMAFLLVLGSWLGTANAQTGVVSTSVKLCVDYSVQYDDAVNTSSTTADGIGDFWKDNTDNQGKRAGIGLEFRIESSVDVTAGNLGTNGCATHVIDVDTADANVDITVFSNTRRRGVDIEFRYSTDDAGHPGEYWWEDGAEISEVWTNMPINVFSSQTNHDVVIPAVDGWQMLAVATWMIHRSKLGLDVDLERTCCIGGSNPNGTCSTLDGYERDRDPYLSYDPKVWLLGIEEENDAGNDNRCCSSLIRADPSVESTGQYSGFTGAVYEQTRFTLAHELGHVMAGLRMGGRENGQYPHNAPVNDCSGSGSGTTTFTPQETTVCDPKRGILTKEFLSTAAREGWADFMSAWTWNSKNHADCEMYTSGLYADFDLDGEVDNYFGSGDWRNRMYSCRGNPEAEVADVSDPTSSFVGTVNWLDDVQDANQCDRFEDDNPLISCGKFGPTYLSCDEPAFFESFNRSTVFDWQTMFWEMYKVEGYGPKRMSDLYVNMCPRDWRGNDGDCDDDDPLNIPADLPFERLHLSADHPGVNMSTGLSNHIDGIEH